MPRPNKVRYRADRDCWVTKIDGRQVILAHGKAAKAEATTELHRILGDPERRPKGDRGVPGFVPLGHTLAALADMFCEWNLANRAPLTAEFYLRHLKSFVGHLGPEFPATFVRPFHLTGWLSDQKGWNQTTRHGALTAVKRLFSWARKQGYIDADPIKDVEKPGGLTREHALTPAQVERVIGAVDDDGFKNFLIVMLETGARPSEAMRLEAAHVRWDDGYATMPGKTTSRTKRPRVIILSDRAIELLKRLAVVNPTGPLLRNSQGGAWTRNATALRFGRLRDKLGMKGELTAESIRHGFVTDALEKGVPIATVAALAGHSDTTMVSRVYSKLHDRKEHLREAVKKIRG